MNEREYIALRRDTYTLFAGLINQPVSDVTWEKLTLWAGQSQSEEGGFLSPLLHWVTGHQELSDGGLMNMATDFTRLFTGIAEGYGPPPPYEHLYRENSEPSMCCSSVIQCYRSSNVSPLDPYNNVSDHIVAELQYMSLLASQQIAVDSLSKENGVLILQQHRFLQYHLLSWIPPWAKVISRQKSNLRFYALIATALVCFLEHDFKYLGQGLMEVE